MKGQVLRTLELREVQLAELLHFDAEVLQIMKQQTRGRLEQLMGFYDVEAGQASRYTNIPGLSVSVSKKSPHLIEKLREQLVPLGYMPFAYGQPPQRGGRKIAVLKTTNQYDILRVMHTFGNDANISNEKVIAKLTEWEQRYCTEILGADNDWVECKFTCLSEDKTSSERLLSKMGNDMLCDLEASSRDSLAFAAEIYQFCPDIIDQQYYTAAENTIKEITKTYSYQIVLQLALHMLTQEVHKTQRLFLWWD